MQQLQDGAILRKEPHVSHMDTETVNREELLKVQREIEDKIKNAEMEISQKEEELKRSEDSLRTLRSRSRIQDSQKQTRQKVYCGKGVIFPQPWTSTPEENVRQKLLPSEAESRPYDHHDYQVSMDSPQDTSQHDDQYETTRLYSRSTLYPETNANHLARSYPELESSQQARQHSHADAGEESLLHRPADLLADKRDKGLPNMEPETFTGDLLKFPMWLNSFEALIESKTELPSERLFCLAKYTAGDARDCIQGYLTLFTEEAYAQAKYQLKTRYGDKVKVARAYRRKLEDWPSIRPNDGEALQKFADFLWQCHAAMSTISYLGSLDSMEENEKLIRKLLYYIVDRWSRIVDKQLYAVQFDQVGRYPTFAQFCSFVSEEARVACGPFNPRSASSPQDRSNRRARVFSTQGNSATPTSNTNDRPSKPIPKCTFCKGSHYISCCSDFLHKDIDSKKSFTRQNGLCFGCLKRNHIYRDCRNRNPALMENIQDMSESDNGQSRGSSELRSENQSTAVSYKIEASGPHESGLGSEKGILHTMIMPVELGHEDHPGTEVMTYA